MNSSKFFATLYICQILSVLICEVSFTSSDTIMLSSSRLDMSIILLLMIIYLWLVRGSHHTCTLVAC